VALAAERFEVCDSLGDLSCGEQILRGWSVCQSPAQGESLPALGLGELSWQKGAVPLFIGTVNK